MHNNQESDTSNQLESRDCLIAGFRYKNVSYSIKYNSYYSVDMVRLKIKVLPKEEQSLFNLFDTQMLTDEVQHYTSNRTGSYRDLWTYAWEDESFSVGWGLIQKNHKTASEGFLEGNPNKIASHMSDFMARCQSFGARFRLMRWDLAIDFPIARKNLRMLKDRRTYVFDSRGTEYLGQRNSAGRVKLYDKAKEQGHPELDLSRVELTCDGDWTVERVLEKLPFVFNQKSKLEGLSGTSGLVVELLSLLTAPENASYEKFIEQLDLRTARKIRLALSRSVSCLNYDKECIASTLEHARDWEFRTN